MSWGVNASGKAPEVKAELERLFSYPLADKPAGLDDDGERETVRRIAETIGQCLDTFAPEKNVSVSANGHIGFANHYTKAGAYQTVSVSINPWG
jgi:hypothetical protein